MKEKTRLEKVKFSLASIFTIVFIAAATAQQSPFTVTGTITDAQGLPLAGVNIRETGAKDSETAKAGTVSDTGGRYRISVSGRDATLVFSYIGFARQEINVYGQKEIDVVLLEDTHKLSEVVVTALGISREKKALTYTVQEIGNDELNRAPTNNFTSNLSGKIAGLQITSANTLGGSTNVILRGFKSLTQSNQALFVIDGVPVDNTNFSGRNNKGYDVGNAISDINSADIESVNVLKGAAASALYGSRAANGVIIVNTKKGQKGKQALGITVNSTTQFGSYDKSTLPVYQNEYGQGKGYVSGTSDYFYNLPVFNSASPVAIVQTNQDVSNGPAYDANKQVYTWESFVPGNPNYGKTSAWLPAQKNGIADLFETPYSLINSIILEKGTESGAFKIGYTNNHENGGLPNSYINKHQLNSHFAFDLSKFISIGSSFNYINEASKNRNGYNTIGNATIIGTLRQWWATNVDISRLKDEYFRTRKNVTWNINSTAFSSPDLATVYQHDNFYWTLYENYNTNQRDRYFGNIYAVVKPADGLEITARVSRDHYTQRFETRNNIGTFSYGGSGSYSRGDFTLSENNFDLFATYSRQLDKSWNARVMAGGNIRRNQVESIYATTSGGLIYPGVFALSNSRNTPAAPVETDERKGINGLFGELAFSYGSLFTLDATLRRDQSSTLPEDSNDYYYPAISGNFILPFTASWFSFGKIRLNYAEAGNDAPPYNVLPTYVNNQTLGGQAVSSVNTTYRNANLRPERSRSYEAGFEAALFQNRLGFDLTFYNAKTIDQLMPITPSAASGYASYYVNGGAIRNRGVELLLNGTPVKTGDFAWNITLNWSKNKNKVLSLYGNQQSYTIASPYGGLQLVAEVGQPYGVIRGSDYEYKDGQRLIDDNGYPVIAANKLLNIGNINPDWIGGVSNSLSYKDFSFSFLIDVKSGGDVYSADMDFGSAAGLFPSTAGLNADGVSVRKPVSEGGGYLFEGVKADGSANTQKVEAYNAAAKLFPFGANGGNEANSAYIYDASYVKLREVALSYNLPRTWIAKSRIFSEASLSLVGRNLWIIHKNLPYADPEEGQASGNESIGYQTGAYPSVRTFAFNIHLKF